MEYNKENITTYLNGVLLAIMTYLGVSEATSGLLIQIIAPIIAIIIPVLMTYYNEKYPSNLITKTYTHDEVEDLANTIIEDKTGESVDGI